MASIALRWRGRSLNRPTVRIPVSSADTNLVDTVDSWTRRCSSVALNRDSALRTHEVKNTFMDMNVSGWARVNGGMKSTLRSSQVVIFPRRNSVSVRAT